MPAGLPDCTVGTSPAPVITPLKNQPGLDVDNDFYDKSKGLQEGNITLASYLRKVHILLGKWVRHHFDHLSSQFCFMHSAHTTKTAQ